MVTAELFPVTYERRPRSNGEANKLAAEDHAAHDWYRFVLSFPPHLVRQYLERWQLQPGQRVLDPFAGTGTTGVECKKLGHDVVGIEASPMAHFASQTKLDWNPDPDELLANAHAGAEMARKKAWAGIEALEYRYSLDAECSNLLLTNSISPLPLHKILVLRECIEANLLGSSSYHHARLALARTAVSTASNLKFGPEVGVGPAKEDAPVIDAWLDAMRQIADDLRKLRGQAAGPARVIHGDARQVNQYLEPGSVDAVFTSPPYPNEKDYSRTTRLETVLLGFASNKKELQAIKRGLLRSNTRNVYKGDADDQWVENLASVQDIAAEIERRRVAMGKTSGFERLYAKVTQLYFGGMARHLAELRPLLRPGAHLAYVVGDQASYLRVKIPTGEILAQIARQLGYEFVGLDLFRTRLATATKEMLREEVLVLKWV